MATLEHLYDSRCGNQNEQVENFLTAATGLLLNYCPDAARPFALLFGIDIPEGAVVTVLCQEPLYHRESGNCAGFLDLQLWWSVAGQRHGLVVEAKVGSALGEEQPQRYQDAVGDEAVVVALTARRENGQIWEPHATWQEWRNVLQELEGPLVEALRDHLDDWGYGPSPILRLADVEALAEDTQRIDQLDEEMRQAVLDFLPVHATTDILLTAAEDRFWEADDDAGAWFQVSKTKAHNGGSSFCGLGLSIEHRHDHLLSLGWALPLRKRLSKMMVAGEAVPWQPSGIGEWLSARLDSWPLDDTPLVEQLRRSVLRARQGLAARHLENVEGEVLWQAVREPPLPELSHPWTVRELAEALARTEKVRDAAEVLSLRWIEAAHARAMEGSVECRDIHKRGKKFYEVSARAQVGVVIDPAETEAPLQAWFWFQGATAGEAACARAMEALSAQGWEPVEAYPDSSGWTRHARPPIRGRVVTQKMVVTFGDELGDAMAAGLKPRRESPSEGTGR